METETIVFDQQLRDYGIIRVPSHLRKLLGIKDGDWVTVTLKKRDVKT